MKKHISYIILAGVLFATLSFGFQVNAQSLPTITMDKPIQDMTISELQAKIAEILSVIQQLQVLITQLQPGGGVSCNFYRNLYPGISGSDVKCLQQYLNNTGHTVASSGPGSSNNETIYYGSLTRAAVKKWQDANNVEQGAWWGYFGPKSQAIYNEIAAIPGEQEEPPTPPSSGTYCGDNIAQRPSDQGTIEDCDGTDIRNKTCITQGYTGGTLLCSSDCSFNTSLCTGTGPDIPTPPTPGPATSCGDSIMQKPNSEGIYEVCDSTNLGSSTCLTYGYLGGTLSCSSNCITFNTTNCIISSGGGGGGAQTPVGPTCGDNTDNICPSGCTNSQDDDCTYCGDNILQRPNDEGILEVCDNTKLNNQTCITKGFPGGTLQCSNTCLTFDTSTCASPSPPNQAPVLSTIGNKSTNENQQLSFTVSGTDTDGDDLNYSIQDRPSGAEFNASSRTFTWTPLYTQSGTYNTTFTVSDGSLTDTEIITITVNNVNRDPILNPIGDKAVQQNNTLTFTVSGTDPDDDTLYYSIQDSPSGASFNTSTRTFSWTPSNTGTYNTTFTVSDGSLTDTETITITVTSAPVPNNPPVANNQAISLNEDNLINITLSATDLDGDNLTYAIVSNPSQGTLSGTAPNLTYTPNTNYNGSDSFTFRANDGQDISNTATISLTINSVNDAPVLSSIGDKTVDENSILTFTISATDPDNDTLYYSIQDNPSGASFNSSTRIFTWTPTYEQQGTYTPTFIVSDSEYTDQETITITVNNVVTGPVCGDSICEGTETCSTCEADCGECALDFPTDYISWWKFDGDAIDETGTNNGTFNGDATTVYDSRRDYSSDTNGYVLSLDGVGDYVDVGDPADGSLDFGTSDFTISVWIKTDNVIGNPAIIWKRSGNPGYRFELNPAGVYIMIVNATNQYTLYSSSGAYKDGNWHHLVAVIDRTSSISFYTGGSYVGSSGSIISGSIDTTSNLLIGKGSYGYINGSIDDVMIFNRSLSAEEILQIYNAQSGGPPTCTNDSGCLSVGSFCDVDTPYSCSLGGDGCLDRSNGTTCGANETCIGGSCTEVPSCTNDVGCSAQGGFCDGNTTYTCSLGGDGCLDRVNGTTCGGSETCIGGSCTTASSGDVYYVRPAEGSYGIGDGSSYENAWDGLGNIAWGPSGVEAGDTLYICGLHLRTRTGGSAWEVFTPGANGVEGARITIRGDCPGGDQGIVWGAGIMAHESWVNEGSNVWSITFQANHYRGWFFEDVTASSWTVLDEKSSLAEVQATPGSYYASSYGAGSTFYVNTSDSGNPTDRIAANRIGYNVKVDNKHYITWLNLEFYSIYRWLGYTSSPPQYTTYMRWENTTIWYGEFVHFLFRQNSHHMEFINCDVAWATNGIGAGAYPFDSPNPPYNLTIRGCKIHDIGVTYGDTDSHGTFSQVSHDLLIENNEIYNVGSGFTGYIAQNQPSTNWIIRWNWIHDTHTNGGANSRGIELSTGGNGAEFTTGKEIYGNIVGPGVDGIGYRYSYEDVGEFYNNICYECGQSFQIHGYGNYVRVKLRNLISINPATYHILFRSQGNPGDYIIDSDYNLFYPISGEQFFFWEYALGGGGPDGGTKTFAEWQALSKTGSTFDPNSIIADPMFVSANPQVPADFKLQLESSAIDAGIDVGLTLDYESNPIPQGLGPDIGAYEYGPFPARISQTDEKLNNLSSVLSSIRSAVQDILKRIQELF